MQYKYLKINFLFYKLIFFILYIKCSQIEHPNTIKPTFYDPTIKQKQASRASQASQFAFSHSKIKLHLQSSLICSLY